MLTQSPVDQVWPSVLQAVVDALPQGLCVVDNNDIVTICNRRFLALYCLSADVVKPGISLRALIDHACEAGNFSGDSTDVVLGRRTERLKSREPLSIEHTLPSGRILEIRFSPMPDGGWLSTYDDITDRLRTAQRIAHMACHDALTELPNRILLRERLQDGLQALRAGVTSLAVLCLDLDDFKQVNDTLGHLIGDDLLRRVALRIHSCLADGDMAARLGGDEFAVMQRGEGGAEAAEALARRLVTALATPFMIDGQQIDVGVSIGISLAPDDSCDADVLMKNADMALYKAKAEGRRTYRFFEPDMDAAVQARRVLELDIRRAMTSGEFELYFQPIMRVTETSVAGFEALLRWKHPTRGFVPPSEFIPVTEDIGLINELSAWVLRAACREAVRWPDPLKIAVNLSPVQFRYRGLIDAVITALEESELEPERLELEITESVLLQDNEQTLGTLHLLRELGVRICLDDFGTGYSSLSYLRSFPFNKIKIDRSFVRDLGTREDCQAIVTAIVHLARSLGMDTTAEGVETEQQFAMVRAQGCSEVQGYLFSPARTANDAYKLANGLIVLRDPLAHRTIAAI